MPATATITTWEQFIEDTTVYRQVRDLDTIAAWLGHDDLDYVSRPRSRSLSALRQGLRALADAEPNPRLTSDECREHDEMRSYARDLLAKFA